MRYRSFAAIAAGLLIAFALARAEREMPKDVSMIQLLATPEKFNGRVVRVCGFLRLAFEGDALYLHREDDTQALTNNAVWVDRTEEMERDEEKLNGRYALIEATFNAEHTGHMGLSGGALTKVTRVSPWPPPPLK